MLLPRVSDKPFDVVPTREGYDRWADVYDGDGNALCVLEEPHVDALLGPVAGLDVLDVGCGTGRHALRLALAGARVTGLDFSEGMLAQARSKPGADAVRFVVHDATSRLPFAGESFDRVLSCLVLDHVSAVDAHFAELARVCRRDGFVLVSSMHPAMMLRGVQAHFWDATTGRDVMPQSAPNVLSDYVMAATRAGLRFDHMSEHAIDEELVRRCPRMEKHLGWPLLVMMRLVAVGGRQSAVGSSQR
jgi:malonyl-CoA O-methyltransferase